MIEVNRELLHTDASKINGQLREMDSICLRSLSAVKSLYAIINYLLHGTLPLEGYKT